MLHQSGKLKLNLKEPHRRALLRNQTIHLIMYGHLTTTKTQAKGVQRFAEKVVTAARQGTDFNTQRRIRALLPYKEEAIQKLLKLIGPKYATRNGGYTRVISMGKRMSDTASVARLEWV